MKQQECIPVGCVPSAAVAIGRGRLSAWGVFAQGCLPGGCLPRGCLPRGVSAQGGCLPREGCVSQYAMGQTSPQWTEFLTHTCENITVKTEIFEPVLFFNSYFAFTLHHSARNDIMQWKQIT